MTTSVVIAAHNEARRIEACIVSLLAQSKRPDEIIIVAHNCSDDTERIARSYPVRVIPLAGPSGVIHARIEGIRQATGEVILLSDGDSYFPHNWVSVMSETLSRGHVLVGSWVKFRGTVWMWLSNFFNKYFITTKHSRSKVERWIWGASMGFWGKDKEFAMEVFERSGKLSRELGLTRNPDDFWFALFMKSKGSLAVTNRTHVTTWETESSSREAVRRSRENMSNAKKMEAYMTKVK